MLFFIDESVNRGVCAVLTNVGCTFQLSVDVLGQGAPDLHVARAADERGAVVLDCNYKDFKQLISRRPPNNNLTFLRIGGRVSLRCAPQNSAARLAVVFTLLNQEWEYRQNCQDKRVIADILGDYIRIDR